MYCFISEHTNVYWNLALEEFLLKHSSEDFFFLWRSESSVVIGKHQNPYKEINIPFAVSNKINIARRMSGGGTVYQDAGNINFTFIKNTKEGKQIDLQQHSKPVFRALRSLGVDVKYSKRNDMLLDGKKFSGNAEHVFKNRVLHHGTILFNSDLDILEEVLKSNEDVYSDKTIASVRSKVTNISHVFGKEYDTAFFMSRLLEEVVSVNEGMSKQEPLINTSLLDQLIKEKYSTSDWIYSYTPKYEFERNFSFTGNDCSIKLSVVKGEIISVETRGFLDEVSNTIKSNLIGRKHLLESINALIRELPREYEPLLAYFI